MRSEIIDYDDLRLTLMHFFSRIVILEVYYLLLYKYLTST